MKVRVNIDSLVLNGISRHDAAAFTQSFEQELSRLVKENGVDGVSGVDVLDAGTVRLARNAKPDLAGAHAARSLYRSLGKK